MLTDRKAAILQAVVEGYISTSNPVGSSYVKKSSELDVSAATVRNEMVALEEAGYLHQPYTSAGRIPTDKGYRYFVDALMEPHKPDQAQTIAVQSFFETAQGELERTLKSTSRFLSQLTDYAAVVTGTPVSSSQVRAVDLVSLDSEHVMVVVVHQDGGIGKHSFGVDASTNEDAIAQASQVLRSHLVGVALNPSLAPETSGNTSVDSLVATAMAGIAATHAPSDVPLYVGGAAGVAGIFDAVEQVREVLALLDKQYLVITLMKDIIDRGMKVAIGSETGVEPLAACSLVVAPYEVEGTKAGSIAVLGPTHMNYAEALATVGMVSKQLGHRLTEG